MKAEQDKIFAEIERANKGAAEALALRAAATKARQSNAPGVAAAQPVEAVSTEELPGATNA
jgi:hypothetical protein